MLLKMDVICQEFRELSGCNCMSLNRNGSLALIGGKRVFGLIRLEEPETLMKKIGRQSQCKYEVSASEFSPQREELAAVASNDRIELIDWMSSGSRDRNLQALIKGSHTRAVTDLSWNTLDHPILASGSIDCNIFIWDTRGDLRKPKISLASVAGVSSVQWERLGNGYCLASAHEGEIKYWDVRHPSSPAQSFNSHLSKIYSLDFSPIIRNKLVSSSQDSSVKLWDISGDSGNKHFLNGIRLSPATSVWKTRFTPFGGEGILTLMKTNFNRGENNLMMWNIFHNRTNKEEFTFTGHNEMVLDFAWRNQFNASNDDDYYYHQLVTWSKDNYLRIWPIGPKLRNLCGSHEIPIQTRDTSSEDPIIEDESDNNIDDIYKSESSLSNQLSQLSANELPVFMPIPPRREGVVMSTARSSLEDNNNELSLSYKSTTLEEEEEEDEEDDEKISSLLATSLPSNYKNMSSLQQEFSLLNFGDKLTMKTWNIPDRYCVIFAETLRHNIVLQVKFPLNYPTSDVPSFSFLEETTLDPNVKAQLLRKLKLTAIQQVGKGRLCLEMCLRQFETSVENLHHAEEENYKSHSSKSDLLGGYQDSNIPFPRTSGARFCGSGQLVCFGYSYNVMLPPAVQQSTDKAPRSLTAVTVSNPPPFPHFGQSPSIKNRAPRVRFGLSKSRLLSTSSIPENIPENGCQILIYDLTLVLPFSRKMAENCSLSIKNESIVEVCQYNGNLASSLGRKDLSETWFLASTIGWNIPASNTCNLCKNIVVCKHTSKKKGKKEELIPWSQHPFGRRLLESLIRHYIQLQDIQTAAMLICTFYEPLKFKSKDDDNDYDIDSPVVNVYNRHIRKNNSKSECSIDTGRDLAMELLAYKSAATLAAKHGRSNSDTQSLEEYSKQINNFVIEKRNEEEKYLRDKTLLDPDLSDLYDDIKKSYSELLLRMGLMKKSIQVRKKLTKPYPEMSLFSTLTTRDCASCSKPIRGGSYCRHCNSSNSSCVLCLLPTKGLSSICIDCGHGGHLKHVEDWFKTHKVCPTGCGCICINN